MNVSQFRDRWHSDDMKTIFREIMDQRFNLDTLEKKAHASDRDDLIVDLKGIDLTGSTLRDFILIEADARWASFHGATIEGPFQDVDVSYCDFSEAEMAYSSFLMAKVIGANFVKSKLRSVNFEESDVSCSDFTEASFVGVGFYHSNLVGVNFDSVKFSGVTMLDVKIDASYREYFMAMTEEQCKLIGVDWHGG